MQRNRVTQGSLARFRRPASPLGSGRKRSSGVRGAGHPLVAIAITPAAAESTSPFVAKHS
jgi:hypothetical protein